MNHRELQLREQDVRKDAPDLDPGLFLRLYIASNFPQTAVFPSPEQKERGVTADLNQTNVNYSKKPLSGTSFDNPAGY
jgi:hypothetical protein